MAFESDFKEFFVHAVTISAFSSQDGYGVLTYTTGATYSARVVNSVKMVRDDSGQEKVSKTQVWINTVSAISTRDRITLSSQFTPSQPSIFSVAIFPDESGSHHTVVYFGTSSPVPG